MDEFYKITVSFFDMETDKHHRFDIDIREASLEEARNFVMTLCQMTHDALRSGAEEGEIYCNANMRRNSFAMGLQRGGQQYPLVVYEINHIRIISIDNAIETVRQLGNNIR